MSMTTQKHIQECKPATEKVGKSLRPQNTSKEGKWCENFKTSNDPHQNAHNYNDEHFRREAPCQISNVNKSQEHCQGKDVAHCY